MKYLRYVVDNDYLSARCSEKKTAYLLNCFLGEKVIELTSDGFAGYWIGDEPGQGDDPIMLYTHGKIHIIAENA
jgi:hypothetical protein